MSRSTTRLRESSGPASHHDHPLSPASHPVHPALKRGISSSAPPPGYFDIDDESTTRASGSASRNSVSGRRSTNATTTEADLLGVGPSRKLGKGTTTQVSAEGKSSTLNGHIMERSKSRRSWKVFLQSLSKEEMAIIETDFDGMPDDQLQAYLSSFDPSSGGSRYDKVDQDGENEAQLEAIDIDHAPAPRFPGETELEPPLFPPSPPGETQRELVDHPLRILSRAVRELREVVETLEDENEKLRLLKEVGGVRGKRDRRADQVSIHEGLSEALATSLSTDRTQIVEPTPSIRSSSPGPSIRRTKSPAPSVKTMPIMPSSPAGAASLYSVKSADPGSTLETTSKKPNGNRSSWTSGLWVWSGTGSKQTKTRPRKGSVGSVLSQAGTLGNVVEDETLTGSRDQDEDEESWRKGDGGSSPSFRAIFLATRIITPDPSSILVSAEIPSTSLVAYLAHALVSNARDQGILAKDAPGRRRGSTVSRSRAASAASADQVGTGSESGSGSRGQPSRRDGQVGLGYSDQALAATASLGRSLLSTVSNATIRAKVYPPSTHQDDRPNTRPRLLNRVSSSRPNPTTALTAAPVTPQISHSSSHSGSDDNPTLPSVEMASIVPDEYRPPTVLLSRRQLGSFFQSSKSVPTLRTATRFSGSEPPLTDRYGFIYDIHHASMLKDANEAGAPAPAPLNGTFHGETEGEGWIDRNRRRKSQERPSVSRSSTGSQEARVPSPRRSIDLESSTVIGSTESPQPASLGTTTPSRRDKEKEARSSSHPDVKRVRGASSISMKPSPPRTVTAKDTLTVSARGSSSLHSRAVFPSSSTEPTKHTKTETGGSKTPTKSPGSASLSLPPENAVTETNSSRVTVSSLLDRLTSLHDVQQKERKSDWDDFLRHRRTKLSLKSKSKSKSRGNGNGNGNGGGGGGGREDMASGGPGLIGVSEMGRGEEWKSFMRLVRGGIPLSYRSDIWAECSGAKDMMIPGEYAEIQTVHRDDTSPFLAEIEKDVTRTFPGNVYFGGDGPGVAKLRRVLVAYSWYNPEVGYCQGMNMLAATLLLTHTDEEQAYWTLVSILSRILPSGYYTPDLLSSRADQSVLAELVALYVPKVHAHLESLGVDLSSITFGWFLSLFTDCLPVETLFRVWDVFFVEGHDTLFRIAISILKMHEPEITSCEGVGDLFTLMSNMTSRLWAADKLIAMQHAYKPIMKHGDIKARCERRVAELSAQAGDT